MEGTGGTRAHGTDLLWGSAIHRAWRALVGDLAALHDATGTVVTPHAVTAPAEHPAVPASGSLVTPYTVTASPDQHVPALGTLVTPHAAALGTLVTTHCHIIPRAGRPRIGDLVTATNIPGVARPYARDIKTT